MIYANKIDGENEAYQITNWIKIVTGCPGSSPVIGPLTEAELGKKSCARTIKINKIVYRLKLIWFIIFQVNITN